MSEFTNKIARIISIIFIPPFFTLIGFILFSLHLETDSEKIFLTITTVIMLGVIAPILLFLIFRHNGKLTDKDASVREERTLPYLIALGFYIIGFLILFNFNVNNAILSFWFCYISNTIITIFINLKWKISAHAMGAAGPIAALFYLFGPVMLLFVIIAVIVGWSRIELKCHTFSQVTTGIIFAFFSTYVQMHFITEYFYK